MTSQIQFVMVVVSIAIVGVLNARAAEPWDGTIVQHGKMHEAIGKQQHQGRVQLSELVKRPHFFAVAALEGLAGEVTIHNGTLTVTSIDSDGQLKPVTNASHRKATMLVGAYIPSWTRQKVAKKISPKDFDQFIADTASAAGIDTTNAFVFTVEGEFSDVSLHVINGACPIHARMKEIDLPKDKRPFAREYKKIQGTLVGVFAKDSVGNLTHPATWTHAHILFKDRETDKQVTGHIERIGLLEGSVVMLPK